jgi:hypothetical protein
MKILTITEDNGQLKVEPNEEVTGPLEALIMLDVAKNAIMQNISKRTEMSKLILPPGGATVLPMKRGN